MIIKCPTCGTKFNEDLLVSGYPFWVCPIEHCNTKIEKVEE